MSDILRMDQRDAWACIARLLERLSKGHTASGTQFWHLLRAAGVPLEANPSKDPMWRGGFSVEVFKATVKFAYDLAQERVGGTGPVPVYAAACGCSG